MAHQWKDYVPPGLTTAMAFISEPWRRCPLCGAVQQRETDTLWMRIRARRWRPLAGRCKGKATGKHQ